MARTIRKCIYDAPISPSDLTPQFFSTHQHFVFDGISFYKINGYIVSSMNSLVPFDPLLAYGEAVREKGASRVHSMHPQLNHSSKIKETPKYKQFMRFISNPANLKQHTILNEISGVFHYNEDTIKTTLFHETLPDIFMFLNGSFESLIRFRLLCTLGILPYFINPNIFKIVIRGGMALRMQIIHTHHMDRTGDSSGLIEGAPMADIDCMILIDRNALNDIQVAGTTCLSEKIELFKTTLMKILLFSIRRPGPHIITCNPASGDKTTTKIVVVDKYGISHELADISFKFLDDDIIRVYQEVDSPFIYDYFQQIYPNSLTCHWSFIHINSLHNEYETVSRNTTSKLESISEWEAIPGPPEEKIFPIPSIDPRVPPDVTTKHKSKLDLNKFYKKNEITSRHKGTGGRRLLKKRISYRSNSHRYRIRICKTKKQKR